MRPSVGRIVHYSPGGSDCYAAMVTAVETGDWIDQDTGLTQVRESVCLDIYPPMRPMFQRTVFEGAAGGTWHWPERVQ